MSTPALDDHLEHERRRRLAAERLLAQKSDELFHANRQLASHADKLSYTVIEQRQENEDLQDERQRVIADLDVATEQAGRAERRLWDSLEAIGDGFAVYDTNWCLVAANRHYLWLFDGVEDVGLGTPFDLVLQVLVDEGIVDYGHNDPDDWVDDMLARWEQRPIEDTVIKLYNGRSIQIQDRVSSDGGIVSMCTDITDALKRESDMQAAKDAAEAANRAKSAFLAKMSHEIRTPMNGVVGMADLLLEAELDDENRLYAETIRNSGEALLLIINDILDFSKLEAEKMVIRSEPLDLERIMLEMLRLAEASMDGKSVALRLQYPVMGRTHFMGDSGKIRQLLTNLVGNAIKFTENGHVTIRVDIGPPNAEGHPMVTIAVQDTGIGIPEDKHEHIFGEFNQVEDEKNRKFEGTGLGLAITRALIERMNGTLSIESAEGVGSTFTAKIPMTPNPDMPAPTWTDIGQRTIGLIGYGAETVAFMKDQLAPLGATVVSATTETLSTIACDALFMCACLAEKTQSEALAKTPTTLPVFSVGAASRVAKDVADRSTRLLSWPIPNEDLRTLIADLALHTPPVAPQDPIALEPPHTAAEPRETLRMLAAEDNKTNQFVFKKMLKSANIELTLVENGRLAVEAYLDLKPHIIFTDISMPEMDGMEATRAIRALEAEHGLDRVPIIAMTAHALDDDENKIKEAGLDHYLTKPLKKNLLLEALVNYAPEGMDVLPTADT